MTAPTVAGAVLVSGLTLSSDWTYCGTNGTTCQGLICGAFGATVSRMRTGRPKAERSYSVTLRVRVLPETDTLIRRAAESAARRKGSGDVSSWVRETLTAAARRELAK